VYSDRLSAVVGRMSAFGELHGANELTCERAYRSDSVSRMEPQERPCLPHRIYREEDCFGIDPDIVQGIGRAP
jgi:hypothetical protein